MQCNYKCNSLVTSFPSYQVSIFIHMDSVHFSAFSLRNPPCVIARAASRISRSSGVVWRRQPSISQESAPAPNKIGRKGGKGEILWAHTCATVSSRPRERCVQSLVSIGSEMWICIRYKQTFIFIYKILAGVPGVARDEKLRKQIFEITWRDKGWIG